MEMLQKRVAGLDVPEDTVVACARPMVVVRAVAAPILTAIYQTSKSRSPLHDLGGGFFDLSRAPETKAKRLVSQLSKLGHAATPHLIADAA